MVQSMIVMSCSQSSWTHFRMMKRKHLAISRDFMLLWARQTGEVELNHQKLTINFYGSFTEAVGMICLFLNSILILIKMTLLKYKTYCIPSEQEKTRVHRVFCALEAIFVFLSRNHIHRLDLLVQDVVWDSWIIEANCWAEGTVNFIDFLKAQKDCQTQA